MDDVSDSYALDYDASVDALDFMEAVDGAHRDQAPGLASPDAVARAWAETVSWCAGSARSGNGGSRVSSMWTGVKPGFQAVPLSRSTGASAGGSDDAASTAGAGLGRSAADGVCAGPG
jgi:hypothetical protein